MLLQNKKIAIKPIIKNRGLFEKGHDGEFMYTGTVWSTDLARNKTTNRYKNIFESPEEQAELEKALDLEENALSVHKKDNPFWAKHRVKLTKEVRTLDLMDPWDVLDYKILTNCKFIAPDWDSINKSGEYKFALVDEDALEIVKASKSQLKKTAYKHFGKIDDSITDMQMIIRLMTGKRIDSKKIEFLQAEIDKLIDTRTEDFVNVVEDKNYKLKVLIENCIDRNILEKNHLGEYKLKGNVDSIARGTEEMVNFLLSPKNGDILLKLKSQLDK
jgi:hypothetical protein